MSTWVTVRDRDLPRRGLRCVGALDVNKTKQKKSSPDPQRNKSDSRTKYLDKLVRKPEEIETCDKAECSGEDLPNGDLISNLPHPRVE